MRTFDTSDGGVRQEIQAPTKQFIDRCDLPVLRNTGDGSRKYKWRTVGDARVPHSHSRAREDRRIKSVPGLRRSIFFHSNQPWHSDVFYDVLEFSHEIDLRGRLEIDYPTLSLVDLLLEKMQIARINEKDVIDTLMLLREHEVGETDDRTIGIGHLARSCKADWGLWKTVTTNLDKVDRLTDKYDVLGTEDRHIIRQRLAKIRAHIDRESPTIRWRLRNRIGERVQWYRDVDEVK